MKNIRIHGFYGQFDVVSLFSGIGAFESAMRDGNVPYKLVNYCEIDKYASTSYSAMHNVSEELNLGDITKVNPKDIGNINLLVWGSPCTDFSNSGTQNGCVWTCKKCGTRVNPLYLRKLKCSMCGHHDFEKTSSSLLVEGLRIIDEKRPKYIIYENVKDITSKKFEDTFELYLTRLEEMGYTNSFKVLNGKDFGVPQNRERLIMVSIHNSEKDTTFEFPSALGIDVRLKDVLEFKDDDYLYLSDEIHQRYVKTGEDLDRPKINIVGTTKPKTRKIGQRDWVYGINGIIGTLTATDYKQPKTVYVKNANGKFVRKISTKESYKIMGFSDEDYIRSRDALRKKYYKGKARESCQMYKQAGNSIVVPMLTEVIKAVYKKALENNKL